MQMRERRSDHIKAARERSAAWRQSQSLARLVTIIEQKMIAA